MDIDTLIRNHTVRFAELLVAEQLGLDLKEIELEHADVWTYLRSLKASAEIGRFVEDASHVEVERLRKDLDDAAKRAEVLACEVDELLVDLENGPEEIVEIEEAPSEDSSLRDVLEWLSNGCHSALTTGAERRIAKIRRLQEDNTKLLPLVEG